MHFKKVLVPIDFSDCSKQALNYAFAFAEQFASEVILLNVIQNNLTSFEYGESQAGNVRTQASSKFRKVPDCKPDRLAAIAPATPEERTCVVLTGSPNSVAKTIVIIVTISADTP